MMMTIPGRTVFCFVVVVAGYMFSFDSIIQEEEAQSELRCDMNVGHKRRPHQGACLFY